MPNKLLISVIMLIAISALLFSIGIGGSSNTGQNTGQNQQQTQQTTDQTSQQKNESQTQKTFKCDPTSFNTMNARIRCFLSLSDDDIRNVNYVPEECILKQSQTDKNKCIEKYKLFQTCRPKPSTDERREQCILPKLNISNTVRNEVEKCKGQPTPNLRNICMSQIREKVLDLVKFRVYNLIYKAQELKSLGVPEEKVIAIIEKINNAKIALDNAPSNNERIEILENLKADWQSFSNDAKNYVKRR